jgi:hypothetical protein
MTEISVTFVGNIANEDGQRTIIGNIKNMLLDTLYVRTYFWSIVNGKPYKDDYEQSDARMYFQCGLTCALKQDWGEALSWYTMGSRAFTCGATLFDRSSDIQCDWDHEDMVYDVCVQTWFNTMYGSKQELHKVGYLWVSDLHIADMTGHDVTDRMSVLRDEWFEVVAAERKQIEANEAAIKEFRKSFEYDN